VPVLAIAAHIPSPEIGSQYFQETHPEHLSILGGEDRGDPKATAAKLRRM